MTWMAALYETYERCAHDPRFEQGEHILIPVSHTSQQAHIEVAIDEKGNFLRGRLIGRQETLIPATEESAGRTSGAKAHPLADKIQYCAGDYPDFGGRKEGHFDLYLEELHGWCASSFNHPKASAVLAYTSRRSLVADLLREKVLAQSDDGMLLSGPEGEEDPHQIFSVLPKQDGLQDQGSAFVRWVVERPGDPNANTWSDPSLIEAWQRYDASRPSEKGLCYVSGELVPLASQHPAKLRHGGDKAKLISSNDDTNFTFLGRFTDPSGSQACQVGISVTQKAHSALRWLVARQGYRNNDQTFVSWAVSGKRVPQPFASTLELFAEALDDEYKTQATEAESVGDVGQLFALRLRKLISGYSGTFAVDERIAVMGLESATPGRMAIVYWRLISGSEFLERIQGWHNAFAWSLRAAVPDLEKPGKKRYTQRESAPSPREIVKAAYGRRADSALLKSTLKRIAPCILEARPFPFDLVQSAVRAVSNPAGFEERWEWEDSLNVACAIFKGFCLGHPDEDSRRRYAMTLEKERCTRNYLYGRLLAFADHVEGYALYLAGERRDTAAFRLMQRFSDRPFSTWKTLETQLVPYLSRVRSRKPGYASFLSTEMDQIFSRFESHDFTDDSSLSGEFLLGFHCQRRELRQGQEQQEQASNQSNLPNNSEEM